MIVRVALIITLVLLELPGCGERTRPSDSDPDSFSPDSELVRKAEVEGDTTQAMWFADSTAVDLTGDGQSEWLVVKAFGEDPDSLEVFLNVRMQSSLAYADTMRSSQYFYPEDAEDLSTAQRRLIVERTLRNHLSRDSFREPTLENIEAWVIEWRHDVSAEAADSIRAEILADVPYTYDYYTGGDGALRIAWSPRRGEFIWVGACC